MNSEIRVGILVLIINTLIAVLYFLINLILKKEHSGSFGMRTVVMLLCPVVGPVFFLFGWIYYMLFMDKTVDLGDVIFSKERVETFRKADEVHERDIVPMTEAMAVSDKASTRELMLDFVRKDIHDSLFTIAAALNSDDSEVSHYAASVLQEALSTFRMNVQKLYTYINELQKEEGNGEEIARCSRELIEILNSVLKQNVLSPMEQRTYVDQMEEMILILQQYATILPEEMENMCMRLFDIKDYERCEQWCNQLSTTYPDLLAAYTCRLKLYYTVGDRERFFRVMDELKKSNVIVDNETLEMIRVFS